MFTHSYGRAVARPAAAQVVVGNDVNGVPLAAVQVVPAAAGGGCGAHVGVVVAVPSHRDG